MLKGVLAALPVNHVKVCPEMILMAALATLFHQSSMKSCVFRQRFSDELMAIKTIFLKLFGPNFMALGALFYAFQVGMCPMQITRRQLQPQNERPPHHETPQEMP
jgi:hypothetical protein